MFGTEQQAAKAAVQIRNSGGRIIGYQDAHGNVVRNANWELRILEQVRWDRMVKELGVAARAETEFASPFPEANGLAYAVRQMPEWAGKDSVIIND